ncbi:hypothetical protein SLE2022_120890 [Rubroshorea leprosula]
MASSTPLHFLLVPLMSQSHLIPFTNMAQLLASRGLNVTLVVTPQNAARVNTIIVNHDAQESGLDRTIQLLEAGSSSKCGSNDPFVASNMMQEPLENWLQTASLPPDCIVSDFCLPWTSDLSRKFGIPKVVFHTISCFSLLCSQNISIHKAYETVKSHSEPFLAPDIPDKIMFTKAQLPTTGASDQWVNLLTQFKLSEKSSDGVLVNSFQEMEPGYVEGYRKQVKNLWCIGPLCGNKGASIDHDGHDCLSWLDTKDEKSVIYVCFGSISNLSSKQLIELGLGLEASGSPFIWIIKKTDCSPELENWFMEEKFVERTKGRGLIIRGWAPQVLILSHPAIGGFLTHCGWNSILEGISAGVPMLTWPMFAEQFFNETFMVEVLKIGVRLGVVRPAGEKEKEDVLVMKEEVAKGVKEVMDGGEDGEWRRKRAREVGEMGKRAVEGGSSYSNVTSLIEYVTQQEMSRISPV